MADIIHVPVQLITARIGLDQEPIGETRLAKHPAVGNPIAIRPNVTTSRSWINAISVLPPARRSWSPIVRLEFKRPLGSCHILRSRRRLALRVGQTGEG